MLRVASLDKPTLRRIYELTYKYGWLSYEEKNKGWLPDAAYKELYKVREALTHYLAEGMSGMIDTYQDWLDHHTEAGWVEGLLESGDSEEDTFDLLESQWKIDVASVVARIAEERGGSRRYLDQEDDEYLVDVYGGSQFIDHYLATPAGKEHAEEYATLVEESDEDSAAKELIKEHGLEEDLKDWLIDVQGWTVTDHFNDMGSSTQDATRELMRAFSIPMEYVLKHSYDLYLDHFSSAEIAGGKSLRENISDVSNMLSDLESASGSLDEQIKAFQLGLTTMHHYGTMADHLLETSRGKGADQARRGAMPRSESVSHHCSTRPEHGRGRARSPWFHPRTVFETGSRPLPDSSSTRSEEDSNFRTFRCTA